MFLSSLMAIAAVLIMGVISPGLSFILSRAMYGSPARACMVLVTALGTGAGAAIFLLWRCWACRRCSPRCPELFIGLKVAGGSACYGWAMIFRGSAQADGFLRQRYGW